MFSNAIRATAFVAVTMSISLATHAEERATPAEAKVMLAAASAHLKKVGTEQAYKDFNDQSKAEWQTKDLYVVSYNFDGLCLVNGANAKRIGKNAADLKDQNGKLFIREFIEIAKKGSGSGSVSYDWMHPDSKKIESKTMFVQRVEGSDTFLGVGAYSTK